MTAMTPLSELVIRLEKSARNGSKAHIPPELSRRLIETQAYRVLLDERTEEMSAQWREETQQRSAPRSARSGSGIAKSATNGASAGMTKAEPGEVVGPAERRRALQAVDQIARLKPRTMRSRTITPDSETPSSSPPQKRTSRG